ncbi:MAG: HAD family phosphatase [Termitinemataceae bacterium]|nr:MAG: HAD family phosphatase [Termitinemataceae bacterium]
MKTKCTVVKCRPEMKAAIFDLDGLMVDTERPYIKILIDESKKRGFDVPLEIFAKCIGIDDMGSEKILKDCIGSNYPYREVRTVALERFLDYLKAHGIKHRPGLLILLNHLKEKQIPIAVASSTATERGKLKLKLANIIQYFDALAFGDEVANCKPAPDVFLLAASRLNVSVQDCIGFEDSPAGLCALHNAGIKSVFIKDTVQPDQSILDFVYKSYQSLDKAVELF